MLTYYLKSGPKAKLLNLSKAESEESSSEEDEAPKNLVNGDIKAKPGQKKADSSDESSSEEEAPKKAPVKPSVKPTIQKKQESSSSEVSECSILCKFRSFVFRSINFTDLSSFNHSPYKSGIFHPYYSYKSVIYITSSMLNLL